MAVIAVTSHPSMWRHGDSIINVIAHFHGPSFEIAEDAVYIKEMKIKQ